MILIADCGGSKCDWAVGSIGEKWTDFETSGFNAATDDFADFHTVLINIKSTYDEVSDVHFYGAGVLDVNKERVRVLIQSIFPSSKINVESDLIAAAKASAGDDHGIVCILGTGSNAFRYKGEVCDFFHRSMGYIIGDEGGGIDVGKSILSAYYRGELSKEVADDIARLWPSNYDDLIQEVYSSDSPKSVFLKFSSLLEKISHHKEVVGIMEKRIDSFLSLIRKQGSPDEKIFFVGSMAYVNRKYIEQNLAQYNLKVHKFVQKPIKGLVDYYMKKTN